MGMVSVLERPFIPPSLYAYLTYTHSWKVEYPGHMSSLAEGAGTGTGFSLLGIFNLKIYEAEARTLLCFIF